MENDKIILDVPSRLWGQAMIAIVRVKGEYPDQRTGTSNAIIYPLENTDYQIIRNVGSYTAKVNSPSFGNDDLEKATPPELTEE